MPRRATLFGFPVKPNCTTSAPTTTRGPRARVNCCRPSRTRITSPMRGARCARCATCSRPRNPRAAPVIVPRQSSLRRRTRWGYVRWRWPSFGGAPRPARGIVAPARSIPPVRGSVHPFSRTCWAGSRPTRHRCSGPPPSPSPSRGCCTKTNTSSSSTSRADCCRCPAVAGCCAIRCPRACGCAIPMLPDSWWCIASISTPRACCWRPSARPPSRRCSACSRWARSANATWRGWMARSWATRA